MDDGHPSSGNYWSDFVGTDEQSGLYQDQLDIDGIVDSSKSITAGNIDHYPLNSSFPQTPNFDIGVSPSANTGVQGSTVTTYVYVFTIAGYDYLVSLVVSEQSREVMIDFNPNTENTILIPL